MNDEVEVYRELRKHIDKMPVGFPSTKSGVEIRILKHLFTPEEARIALNLSALPESLERITGERQRAVCLSKVENVLDRLVEKAPSWAGTPFKGRKGKYYSGHTSHRHVRVCRQTHLIRSRFINT
jgi:hypothetical protein